MNQKNKSIKKDKEITKALLISHLSKIEIINNNLENANKHIVESTKIMNKYLDNEDKRIIYTLNIAARIYIQRNIETRGKGLIRNLLDIKEKTNDQDIYDFEKDTIEQLYKRFKETNRENEIKFYQANTSQQTKSTFEYFFYIIS